MILCPPRSSLLPYPTLFRSGDPSLSERTRGVSGSHVRLAFAVSPGVRRETDDWLRCGPGLVQVVGGVRCDRRNSLGDQLTPNRCNGKLAGLAVGRVRRDTTPGDGGECGA